jgi:hypothetical protein
MTIGVFTTDEQSKRETFRALRNLRDLLNSKLSQGQQAKELSMGMSDDFLLAIKEGSTMIRIGTNIFGSRKTNA